MAYWVENWRKNVFKDNTPPGSPVTSITIVAARNETEAGQIVLRHTAGFTVSSVTSANLASGSNTLSNTNFKWHFVDYFTATKNSGGPGYCDVTMTDPVRVAPADFPEQLSNDTSRAISANTSQPIWIKYRIPTTQNVGTYTGNITINAGVLGTITVPVSIEVNSVTLPDPKDSSFNNEWWIYPQAIQAVYGYTSLSTNWWTITQKLIDMCRELRVNSHISWVQFFYERTDSWAAWDEYIQRLTNSGTLKRITTETMGSNATSWVNNIYLHLTALGLWEKFYMKIMDEPSNVSAYVTLSNQVKAIVPSVKIGDPGITNPAGFGTAVDIWQPHITYQGGYDQYESLFEQKKALPGNEVWVYTACHPTNGAINVHIDNRVFETTLHGWYAFSRNLKGFLFWGLGQWEVIGTSDDSYYQTTGTLGDAYLVWPDIANASIKGSIRTEAVRELAEDYELLRIYEGINSSAAHALAESVITDPFTYEKDIAVLEAKRNTLVRAASSQQPAPSLTFSSFMQAQGADLSNVRFATNFNVTGGWREGPLFTVAAAQMAQYSFTVPIPAGATACDYLVMLASGTGTLFFDQLCVRPSSTLPVPSTTSQARTGAWTTVFFDDFDTFNAANWSKPVASGWSDFYGTNGAWDDNLVYVENSRLKFRVELRSGTWFTGMVHSRDKRSFQYGFFEARIKLPKRQGTLAAWWLMPQNPAYGGWPKSGEIDIMEHIGEDEPETAFATIITDNAAGDGGGWRSSHAAVGVDWTADFHDYGMLWEKGTDGRIIFQFYVDRIPYGMFDQSIWPVAPGGAIGSPFDRPFFMLLDLGVGVLEWSGPPNTATHGAVMEIDWVRVMQRT